MQWEQTENKSSVALYAVGAVGALWFSSAVLSAVNAVPLVCVCGRSPDSAFTGPHPE